MSTIAPNPMPELAPLLKRLRLSGILDSLETRNREAVANKIPYTDFLALLIADEVARREHKKFNLRIRRAGFRSSKTIEQFDFDFNVAINQTLITELATCRFVAEKVAVLIAGPCGTGKSHIAQALPCAPTTMCCSPPRVSCWQPSMPRAPSTLTSDASTPLPACRCSSLMTSV